MSVESERGIVKTCEMFDEEESKKLRIFQRHERHELQLIIERCNEVAFDYVCVPSIRNDKDLCFGSKTPRKIHLIADDKTLNSYVRKCFKEHFPEPKVPEVNKSDDDDKEEETEQKPSHIFASRVPRFNDITIDSTGVYRRRRKTRQAQEVKTKVFCAFGSSSERKTLVTKNLVESLTPGVGAYNTIKPKKNFFNHSFGGDIKIHPAFDIVCAPINLDTACESCEQKPKNVFWKNEKTRSVLCRSCYSMKVKEVEKTRGVVDRHRKLKVMEFDYQKKRYCEFYHEHNKTTAAVRILTPKTFHKRIHQENCLNMKFDY